MSFGPPTTQTRYDDYTGFTKIFDEKTFTNWNGEMDVWSIVDGLLHADTTKTPGQHHLHYTGPGAVMRDFTLKVEVKLSAAGANGGIQYRSRLLHPAHGGSIADPLGKPLPANITTMAQAVAAGITAAPAARGGGGGGEVAEHAAATPPVPAMRRVADADPAPTHRPARPRLRTPASAKSATSHRLSPPAAATPQGRPPGIPGR